MEKVNRTWSTYVALWATFAVAGYTAALTATNAAQAAP